MGWIFTEFRSVPPDGVCGNFSDLRLRLLCPLLLAFGRCGRFALSGVGWRWPPLFTWMAVISRAGGLVAQKMDFERASSVDLPSIRAAQVVISKKPDIQCHRSQKFCRVIEYKKFFFLLHIHAVSVIRKTFIRDN